MPKPPGQAGPLGGARKPFEVGGFVGQITATSMVFGYVSLCLVGMSFRLHSGNLVGGRFQIYFWIFSPRKFGEDEPILTIIFFRWFGSTTNQ